MSQANWRNALSQDQERIPDLIEAIVGYRSWWLRYRNGEWFLTSLRSRDAVWTPGVPFISKCPRSACPSNAEPARSKGVEIPAVAEGCEVCGVHVFDTLDEAKDYHGDVYGDCKVWGEVIDHDNGYRAQLAAPHVLYLPDAIAHPEIVNSLGKRYRVEIVCEPNSDLDIERLRIIHARGLGEIKRAHALQYYRLYSYRGEPWAKCWRENVRDGNFLMFMEHDIEGGDKRSMRAYYEKTQEGLFAAVDEHEYGVQKNVKAFPLLDLVSGLLVDTVTGESLGNVMDQKVLKKVPKSKPAKTLWISPASLRPRRTTKAALAKPWRKRHPILALVLMFALVYLTVATVMLANIASANYKAGEQVLPGVPVTKIETSVKRKVENPKETK